MKTVRKAVAVVLRPGATGHEVLVFRHPDAGVQLPKGTVEPQEMIEAAVLRELEEESGLDLRTQPEFIGTWQRTVGGGPKEDGPLEINEWHIGILRTDADLPDHWHHQAHGSPAEDGLIFKFFWIPVDETLADALHPVFAETAAMIFAHTSTS